MSATATVLRAALRQARIELRIQLFSPLVLGWLWAPLVGILILHLLRDHEVMGSAISMAQLGIPGLIAMTLVSSGVLGVSGQLVTESGDGTLLRAKAIPHGMVAHLIGNVIIYTVTSLVPVLLLLGGAALVFPGVGPRGAAGWTTLAWVSLLGLTATLPLGAVLGAAMRSPLMLAWTSLVVYAGMAISGVFYPLSALPGWLQWIGQALPIYWLGLGLRSALLPAEAVALEIGQSWQVWQTVVALGAWSALGLALAPPMLRRMARRQTGSAITAALERLTSKGY